MGSLFSRIEKSVKVDGFMAIQSMNEAIFPVLSIFKTFCSASV